MTTESSPSRADTSSIARWWNRTRYQLYAPIYDIVARPLEAGRRRAIERADPRSGERVLLLGCGTGSDLNYLPDDVNVTAVDIAPAMVERTRTRAERLGVNVDAQVGDAQALPFDDNAFDLVLLHLILAVVSDPQAVAREAARVLKPAGRATIYDKFVPVGQSPSLLRWVLNPVARFLFSDLTRRLDPLLSTAGLRMEGERGATLGGLYTIALVQPEADGHWGTSETEGNRPSESRP